MRYHFGGQLYIEEAQTKTIKECLNTLTPTIKADLQSKFESLSKTWNAIVRDLRRFECQEVNFPELSLSSPVYLCMPNQESPVAFSVLRGVIDKHNSFLLSLQHVRDEFTEEKLPTVQLSHTEKQHMIGCDNLNEYINDIIFTNYYRTSTGEIKWNPELIADLYIELLKFRPLIQMDNDLGFMFRPRSIPVKHENEKPLPKSIADSVGALEKQQVNQALQQLAVVLNLVLKLHPKEESISSFIREVMQEKPCIPDLFTKCTLSQARALCDTFQKLLQPDRFENVLTSYRAPLDKVSI